MMWRGWRGGQAGRSVPSGPWPAIGMQTRFETTCEDFRTVDGVRFAFREQNCASGVHTGWTHVRTVTLHPRFVEGTFAPGAPSRTGAQGREG